VTFPIILYEEGPCLVVNKPPGLLTQSPPGIDSLERRVWQMLEARPGRPDRIYLGVPHRLDRPASGAILLATRRKAARRLAEQFEARQIDKIYWACVAGAVAPPEGIWEDFVRKVPDDARAEVVPQEHPDARHAVLNYRTLAAAEWGTWLELELETGRTHQVRVQAASHGHPILGDSQYGSTVPFGPQHDDPRLRAIALHARTIAFLHPKTRQRVSVTAPVADYWPQIVRGE
jgi:RluA family pseudouridine synthase